ncbi:hypothetical protein SAMN05216344_102159 [Polaromonas sp. OV174]|uniref:hypothetical protein n=1 Tax=Polaromonas sp. OV174 TaxID=1855300 RepID=UPI0008E278D1|nr:hypothetical protein [Polaromonas sp. OV174]SFB74006.1 hypothetical protein SAMN05216344_102159 [Polaromonas sp. OV174]
MTDIVPVPALVEPAPFPTTADRSSGEYNTKAKTWADTEGLMAESLHAIAEATHTNAAAAKEAADAAATEADAAATAKTNADTAADLASDWATKTGAAVSGGEYSAKHYAQVAEAAVATLPEGAINDAATSETDAWSSEKVSNELQGKASLAANTFTAAQNLATGAAIASAATINLDAATGNRVHITGTTTITAVTLTRGPRTLVFDGVLTLTHHATNNSLPGGANIATAAGDRAIYESDGAVVYCVLYTKANGLPAAIAPYLHVRDEKSVGAGGGLGAGSPTTRPLNTVVTNTIPSASVSTNIVTLPAGTYDVLAAAPTAIAGASTPHKLVLYNNTAAADVLVGRSAQISNGSTNSFAEVRGRFTLAAQGALILRHYGPFSGANNLELGIPSNLAGKNEVYSEVQFWKVA